MSSAVGPSTGATRGASPAGLQARVQVGYPGFALDVDLRVGAGEVVAVLGPNGAGKSTLLRSVAGLTQIDAGSITLGDDVLDAPGVYVPPERRRIGVVFQDHRLFAHLSALDNVAFGLRCQGVSRGAARAAAREWLDRLGLAGLGGNRPRQLSGGQAQRVALARALAIGPRALLLDEPLSALDVNTRAQVQGELTTHLGEFAGPCVVVTHDPVEALVLADRIVVIETGVVVQEGSPAEIATTPATPYVARLVGVNLYAGTASDGVVAVDGGGTLVVDGVPEGRVLVQVRPSAFTVHTAEPRDSSARNVWSGTIDGLTPLGDRVRVSLGSEPPVLVDVTAASVSQLGLAPGRTVWVSAKATEMLGYPER